MAAVDFLLVGVLGFAAGLAALWAVSALPLPRAAARPAPAPKGGDPVAFIFEGVELCDTTEAGQMLLDHAPPAPDDLARIVALFAPVMPGLDRLAALAPGEAAEFPATQAGAVLRATRSAQRLRLVLCDAADPPLLAVLLAAAAQRLRALADRAPLPIWHETADGAVAWANLACGGAPPLPARPATAPEGPLRQQSCAGARWFDRHDLPDGDGGRLVYALPADATVQAEAALLDFLQTLTRCFAHLPIGLAVFDADWRLGIFNPTLGDLTGLSPSFLARRPTLHEVLDRLRELRMIPEPRDYAAWRLRLADLERAAATGHFTEVWPLTSGRTFRITGQPQAEGGLVLLFEDISADTARNRDLRGRADLLVAGFAAIGRPLALLAPDGALVVASRGWQAAWGAAAPDPAQLRTTPLPGGARLVETPGTGPGPDPEPDPDGPGGPPAPGAARSGPAAGPE